MFVIRKWRYHIKAERTGAIQNGTMIQRCNNIGMKTTTMHRMPSQLDQEPPPNQVAHTRRFLAILFTMPLLCQQHCPIVSIERDRELELLQMKMGEQDSVGTDITFPVVRPNQMPSRASSKDTEDYPVLKFLAQDGRTVFNAPFSGGQFLRAQHGHCR